MKTIKVILTVITFATICICQIEVDFTLRNNSSIRVTVPKDTFHVIEEEFDLCGTDTENNNTSSPKNTTAEEKNQPIPYPCEFESETEYEQFRQLWDIGSSAPPGECNPLHQEQASHTADLSKDLFEKCLLTANYLNIQGEYAKRFAENMAKYGLLGAYSTDIVSSKLLSACYLSCSAVRDLLYAFLRQAGFEYRTIECLDTEQTMLRIEKADGWPKQLNKEYTGPFQTTNMRTVLHTRLGPKESLEKERNEAVLAWLLLNMGGSSVDIQYTIKVFSDDISDLYQTIQNLSKENKKGARVHIEGLILNISHIKRSFYLDPGPRHIPRTSRLGLFNISSSLVSTISLCTSLKTLTIEGKHLKSAEVSRLADSLLNLEQLNIWSKRLERRAIDSLKKCTKLEKLEMHGDRQRSIALQELVSNLPHLRELRIKCKALEPAAAEVFQACTQLEKLEINGCRKFYQPSATVQAIVTHLSLLRELSIWSKPLEPAAAEAFQACTKLERLEMWGKDQPSAAVQAIVSHLPSLRELIIPCDVLTSAGAESFQVCTQLEKLEINGRRGFYQPSSIVQAIVTHLPHLRDLEVGIDTVDFALADALRKCPSLRSLRLAVSQYTPGFLARYLQAPLPKLKYLSLREINRSTPQSEEDKRAVKDARAKGMTIQVIS
ncbi:hypothetical protein NECID01_0635 [Nematocida sp. AWRm77]|nr:hypothetical protein NECID01_0635 [Nematocida sp. AWRm77]